MLREAQHEVDHLLVPDLAADLPSVVRDHVGVWSERSGTPARVEVVGDDWSGLGPRTGPALRRVVQEALANVARHSGASRVEVVLARSGEEVVLTVTDDGRGCGSTARSGGRGLSGMRERMAALGGTTTVEGAPGGGTRVTARCPA
jgi:signal transduction histidine kinase